MKNTAFKSPFKLINCLNYYYCYCFHQTTSGCLHNQQKNMTIRERKPKMTRSKSVKCNGILAELISSSISFWTQKSATDTQTFSFREINLVNSSSSSSSSTHVCPLDGAAASHSVPVGLAFNPFPVGCGNDVLNESKTSRRATIKITENYSHLYLWTIYQLASCFPLNACLWAVGGKWSVHRQTEPEPPLAPWGFNAQPSGCVDNVCTAILPLISFLLHLNL